MKQTLGFDFKTHQGIIWYNKLDQKQKKITSVKIIIIWAEAIWIRILYLKFLNKLMSLMSWFLRYITTTWGGFGSMCSILPMWGLSAKMGSKNQNLNYKK